MIWTRNAGPAEDPGTIAATGRSGRYAAKEMQTRMAMQAGGTSRRCIHGGLRERDMGCYWAVAVLSPDHTLRGKVLFTTAICNHRESAGRSIQRWLRLEACRLISVRGAQAITVTGVHTVTDRST